jgi:hypothetical protein
MSLVPQAGLPWADESAAGKAMSPAPAAGASVRGFNGVNGNRLEPARDRNPDRARSPPARGTRPCRESTQVDFV